MSTKALRTQLIAAVAMVLVAAIALGSSTYAWFASNNKVVATGMEVVAQAEGGIQIKSVTGGNVALGTGATTDWATTADSKLTATSLYPTSNQAASATNCEITNDWYYAKAALASASTAKEDTYVKLGSSTNNWTFENGSLSFEEGYTGTQAAPAGQYYLTAKYQISTVAGSASNLKVNKVEVSLPGTSNTGDLDKSIRVAVVCGSNVALYAPYSYTTAPTYSVCTATVGTPGASSTATTTASLTPLVGTAESSAIAATVGTETAPTDVMVYVWYEGEDSNHFTDHLAANIDHLKVSVTFAAEF